MPQPIGQPNAAVNALYDLAPPPSPEPPRTNQFLAAQSRFPPGYVGRRYGFMCTYCSSRLEATETMAGQSGTCPTCGNTIVIPILDYRGRLIDPLSGKVIKQDPHPVHAYAAAGHRAPKIATAPTGDRYIECPRCQRPNALSANNCIGCGLPFTMDGTMGDAIAGTNTWAVAAMVLGIVGLPGFFFLAIPCVLAVIFGVISMRGRGPGNNAGQGMAFAGIILGVVGILLFGFCITSRMWM